MKVLRDVQRRSFHCSEDENTSLRRGMRQKLTDRQLRPYYQDRTGAILLLGAL